MNLWIIFLTGLTIGGLTCLAVQGGLLASVIAAKKDDTKRNSGVVFPTLAFLTTKLVAHTVLGFILGAFGGAIGISETAQITMQFVAGLYMVIIALNLLDVHPIFRYAVIQPPKFLTKRIKHQSKSKDLFAPALLGAMTIFIPCGTTLAMEALAISSANPLLGAAIMAVFVLGTTPLFFGIGWLTSILGDAFRSKFLKIAAIAVIYLGLTSMNGALVAAGSPIALKPKTSEKLYNEAPVSQTIEIRVTASGYSPNYVRVKKGSPVTVKLIGQNAYSCASAFRAPTLGINKNLQPNESYTFTFTPQETGKIPFACSMGMYGGVIEVI
ncbi:MAG: sulfite exporter TauE/SafE family protein [Candidatus Roizmanbacteria bacterium]|nr:sulfite exporter TauE/SafE family protein [Candidatus Roizmanbacteria bacterium]